VTGTSTSANFSGGVRLIKSASSTIDDNYANGNGPLAGIRVPSSPGTAVINNETIGNVKYDIAVQASPPIASVDDVLNAGNTVSPGPDRVRVQ
jgi:parallel beta-helix repeat protein